MGELCSAWQTTRMYGSVTSLAGLESPSAEPLIWLMTYPQRDTSLRRRTGGATAIKFKSISRCLRRPSIGPSVKCWPSWSGTPQEQPALTRSVDFRRVGPSGPMFTEQFDTLSGPVQDRTCSLREANPKVPHSRRTGHPKVADHDVGGAGRASYRWLPTVGGAC
jgi:hypothetical protein